MGAFFAEAVIQFLGLRARAWLAHLLGLSCVGLLAAGAEPASHSRVWVEAPLPSGTQALLRAAGFEQAPPRWRVLEELTRRLHAPYGEYGLRPAPPVPPGSELGAPGALHVRVPLDPELWSRAVFERNVPLEALVGAILQDRRAARLYRGLATLDDPTLRALGNDPESLERLYRDGSEAFAVFGRSLRVVGRSLATPGGAAAAPLWEKLVGVAPAEPARFAARLMTQDGGRLAELYDSLERLDGPRQEFALAVFVADPGKRLEHLRRLQLVLAQDPAWWRDPRPLSRVWPDASEVLRRLPVDAEGRLRAPGEDDEDEQQARGGPLAARLLARVLSPDLEQRDTHALRLALLQPGLAALAPAERRRAAQAFEKRPLLALALGGLGVAAPEALIGAARQAEILEGLYGPRGVRGLTQYQSLLALLLHARRSGGLLATQARSLTEALLADRTVGAIPCGTAVHLSRGWLAAGPAPESREWRLLRALAGPERGPGPVFEWEGLGYRVDASGAQLQRLQRFRRMQGSPSLDASLDVCLALRGGAPALGEARRTLSALSAAAARRQDGQSPEDFGSASPEQLRDEADRLLTDTLRDVVYALALGWPEGTLAVSAQARRHDLELGQAGLRHGPWSVPSETRAAGRPRSVRGSLLGLELALAERSLPRLGDDLPERPPTLHQDYHLPFARAAGVLANEVPAGAAQAAAQAIARGRARVAAAGRDPEALDALAVEARLPGWRRRALPWVASDQPEELLALFGLADLARLGGLAQDPFGHPWGWPALEAAGLLGPRLDLSATPEDLLGLRPGAAVVAALPDLQLRVAELLAGAGLPDELLAGILPLATQELIARVQVQGLHDTGALQRYAASLPRERLDDYLPALVASGFLVPVFEDAD